MKYWVYSGRAQFTLADKEVKGDRGKSSQVFDIKLEHPIWDRALQDHCTSPHPTFWDGRHDASGNKPPAGACVNTIGHGSTPAWSDEGYNTMGSGDGSSPYHSHSGFPDIEVWGSDNHPIGLY